MFFLLFLLLADARVYILGKGNSLSHFQVRQLHQTFRIGSWYPKEDAYFYFWSKGRKVKGQRSKIGKTGKVHLLPQFFSQSFHIFRMCSTNHGQNLCGNRILIKGPPKKLAWVQKFSKFSTFLSFKLGTSKLRIRQVLGP